MLKLVIKAVIAIIAEFRKKTPIVALLLGPAFQAVT